jgi:hypothetical protein
MGGRGEKKQRSLFLKKKAASDRNLTRKKANFQRMKKRFLHI